MISVLMQGTLTAAPMRRTSAAGKDYVTANVRVPVEGDEAILCSTIAFDALAVEALLRLEKGDAVALAGSAKLSRWTAKDGTERTGLSVTASKVMSAYLATKKRRAEGDDRKPEPEGEWSLAEREFSA